jgi:O-antigen ligase
MSQLAPDFDYTHPGTSSDVVAPTDFVSLGADEAKASVRIVLQRLVTYFIPASLFTLTFLFGGVHAGLHLPLYASWGLLVITSLALMPGVGALQLWQPLLPSDSQAHASYPRSCSSSSGFCIIFLVFAVYCFAQLTVLSLTHQAHPIVGSVSNLALSSESWAALRDITASLMLFFLARKHLVPTLAAAERWASALVALGGLVALFALGHWFYDNGKLLGIFEPDSVFISERARWPFVNPNSLGQFLLLPIFLSFSVVTTRIAALRNSMGRCRARNNTHTKQLLTDTGVQRAFGLVVYASIVVVIMLMALAASLSRGSWAGVIAGMIIFLALQVREPKKASGTLSQQAQTRRRRRTPSKAPAYAPKSSLLRYGLLLLALGGVLWLSLNGRGLELIDARIEYGLLHTKEDIRWEMYRTTINMLLDQPWFGIGLGSWAGIFPQYMSPALAGLNPVYLHSDPLQALVELGVLGFSLVLILALYIPQRLVRHGPALSRSAFQIARAVVSGCSALFVASLFDFPLRIPAIVCLLSVCLALACVALDSSGEQVVLDSH